MGTLGQCEAKQLLPNYPLCNSYTAVLLSESAAGYGDSWPFCSLSGGGEQQDTSDAKNHIL